MRKIKCHQTKKRNMVGCLVMGVVLFTVSVQAAQKKPVSSSPQAAQIEVYRYTNDKGQKVLSNQVPPERAAAGYEILDIHGQVKKVVPPALTPEQRAAKEAADKAKARDDELLGLYSGFGDIDEARDGQLTQINNAISITVGNIKNIKSQREKLQSEAATIERGGNKVSEAITKKLVDLDFHVKVEQKRMADYEKEKREIEEKFAGERKRLGELKHITPAASMTPAPSGLQPLPVSITPTPKP